MKRCCKSHFIRRQHSHRTRKLISRRCRWSINFCAPNRPGPQCMNTSHISPTADTHRHINLNLWNVSSGTGGFAVEVWLDLGSIRIRFVHFRICYWTMTIHFFLTAFVLAMRRVSLGTMRMENALTQGSNNSLLISIDLKLIKSIIRQTKSFLFLTWMDNVVFGLVFVLYLLSFLSFAERRPSDDKRGISWVIRVRLVKIALVSSRAHLILTNWFVI